MTVLSWLAPVLAPLLMMAGTVCDQDEPLPSVVQIVAQECSPDNHERSLTGFVINDPAVSDGLAIVTALHGVANCGEIKADSSLGVIKELQISGADLERDIALLSMPAEQATVFASSALTMTSALPRIDADGARESICTVGYPVGISDQWSYSRLTLQKREKTGLYTLIPSNIELNQRGSPSRWTQILRIDGELAQGLSGAPVLNEAGEVFGIVEGGLKEVDADTVSWAIHWADVKFMEVNRMQLRELALHDPRLVFNVRLSATATPTPSPTATETRTPTPAFDNSRESRTEIPDVIARLVGFSKFQNTITARVLFVNSSQEKRGLWPTSGSYLLNEDDGKHYPLTAQQERLGADIPAGSELEFWVKFRLPNGVNPQYLTLILPNGVHFDYLESVGDEGILSTPSATDMPDISSGNPLSLTVTTTPAPDEVATLTPTPTPVATPTPIPTSTLDPVHSKVIYEAIDPGGEVDTYTFDGMSGETLLIIASDGDGSGAFVIEVELISPTGETLLKVSDNVRVQVAHKIEMEGVYEINVREADNTTGNYTLYVENVPSKTETQLEYDSQVTQMLDVGGDVDIYTFNGSQEDTAIIILTDGGSSGAFIPEVVLFDPNGDYVTSHQDNIRAQIVHNLDMGGTYTVVAREADSTIGAYTLYLGNVAAKTENYIDYDSQVSKTIDPGGDVDVYTFDGSQGDTALITLTDVDGSGAFIPELILFAPNGEFVASSQDNIRAQIVHNLDMDGIYAVIVREVDNTMGSYTLYLGNVAAKTENHIKYNSQVNEGIDPGGDVDVYTFDGSQGDTALIALTDGNGSGAFVSEIILFGPNGAYLDDNQDNVRAQIIEKLDEDGTYAIVVRETDNTTGAYSLNLEGVPAKVDDHIDYHSQLNNSIEPSGEIDIYPFDGMEGDTVSLTVTDEDGNGAFVPEVILFDPRGQLAVSDSDNNQVSLNYRLNLNGTYTFVVRETDNTTGNYSLQLNKVSLSESNVTTSQASSLAETQCQQLIGTWRWFNGGEIEITPDGTVNIGEDYLGQATWECTDSAQQKYIIHWKNGYIDTITITDSGKRLEGHNQYNTSVTATRK